MTGLSLPFTKRHRFIPARSRRTSKIYKYCLARVADLLAVPRDANSVAAVILVVPQSQLFPWASIVKARSYEGNHVQEVVFSIKIFIVTSTWATCV